MMTYEEAIAYIHSVSWKGSRPGLARIKKLLDGLGNPQNGLRFVHIAGTNGKGSVSAMTESVLRAAGYRTGLFVSPYIRFFEERIVCCGEMIAKDDLSRLCAKVRAVADTMEDAPTEFELITAIGFLYFAEQKCDVVVLETGLGGRLDATNVIKDPLLTVITGIALDHTAILGDTVEKIAAEKAGIIKSGAPMLYGGRDLAARRVIEGAARKAGVPFVASADIPLSVREMTLSGTRVDFGAWKNVYIPLLGVYQPQNLATVLSAVDLLRTLGVFVSDEALRAGLSRVVWHGRFEKLSEDPLIFSDGAHNPEGIAAATESIKHYFGGEKVILLCGVMADKAYTQMVGTLAPVAWEVYTLTPENPRALSAADLADTFRAAGVPATACGSVPEAVSAALAAARATKRPLFSLGSLYMYKEVVDALAAQGIL